MSCDICHIDLTDCQKCHDSFCEDCTGYRFDKCDKCMLFYFHASITGYKITHHGNELYTLSKKFSLNHYPTEQEIINIIKQDVKLERCKLISYSKLNRKQYEAL